MNQTLRRIAVSGSAAVALLGGAATITAATADTASATEIRAYVDRATGAPVKLPGGRTVHVRGLDNAAYRADAGHYTATVTLASAKTDTTPGVTNGLTPAGGSGAQLQNPYSNQQQIPAGYNQQITTQASGGVIATGVVAMLVLGVIVFFRVKSHQLKVGDAVLVGLLGVALSGTVIGAMATQITNSGVGSLGGVLGGLG
jgi:hypothetical protein